MIGSRKIDRLFFYCRKGIAMIVLIAVLLSALLGFSALAVDVGVLYMNDASLQTALDAGVLAGAYALPDTAEAERLCREYILANCDSAQNIAVTFEGENMVINASAEISSPALFSVIFNNDSLDGCAHASAEKYLATLGGPFDYRLFSGAEGKQITLGGKFYIDGSVHSNGSVSISPSSGTVTGAVEGCTTVYVNQWTASAGSQLPGSAFIPMVDFSGVVNNVLPSCYDKRLTASAVNAVRTAQSFTGNIYVDGNVSIPNTCTITGNMYVNGNIQINGGSPVCVLKGSLYATGSITFNNTAKIDGCVFAGGNITFNGGGLDMQSNDEVCIYSENGNIYVNTAASTVRGIVYAPKGKVQVVGNNTTYIGSIIGNTVAGIPANLTMLGPTEPFSFLETEEKVKLIR